MEPLAKLRNFTLMESIMSNLFFQQYPSPFGTIYIYANDKAIKAVVFNEWGHRLAGDVNNKSTVLIEKCHQQLVEYFAGARKTFNLPLAPEGTEFQKSVWQILSQIPYGESWNYGQLAEAIGNKNASRAVGAANGKNPISIIIPCHRVIGANGSLTGYAGGLAAKTWLLQHEGINHKPL